MITIIGIGEYDENRPFLDQPDEAVKEYLNEKINTFNDSTALTWGIHGRPYTYQYVGEGIVIDSARTYKDDSPNYFIESQTYTLTNGNI